MITVRIEPEITQKLNFYLICERHDNQYNYHTLFSLDELEAKLNSNSY